MGFKKIYVTFFLFLSFFLEASAQEREPKNVGLLIVATGKYIDFVYPLIQSARNHFCQNHHVTYFVFTDQEMETAEDVVPIYQCRLGWPYDTMMRYQVYFANWERLKGMDYLFACDADMLFEGEVGDEILGKRVATLHPGFLGKRGSYETNRRSKAYVSRKEGSYYFAGGFYGGDKESFFHILKTNIDRIEDDLRRGIIAVWHDESHWNRYCIDFPPTVILSPAYCFAEGYNLPYPKKLVTLEKNHAEYRK